MADRIATFEITGELLRQALHLPPGTIFLDARSSLWRHGNLVLKVTHPDLKIAKEGDMIPQAMPQIAVENNEVVFKGWGQ